MGSSTFLTFPNESGSCCASHISFGAVNPGIANEFATAAYRAAGGFEISSAELRWWEVLASLRWGVITMVMGGEHRSGTTRSVEQATIGRRVVETEYDVMLLLRTELGVAS